MHAWFQWVFIHEKKKNTTSHSGVRDNMLRIYKYNSKDMQSWNIWGRKDYWTVQWTVLGWAHHMYGLASKLLRAELPLAFDLSTLCFCASVSRFHLIKCISWYLEVIITTAWGWILMLHSSVLWLERITLHVKVTLASVKRSSSSILWARFLWVW